MVAAKHRSVGPLVAVFVGLQMAAVAGALGVLMLTGFMPARWFAVAPTVAMFLAAVEVTRRSSHAIQITRRSGKGTEGTMAVDAQRLQEADGTARLLSRSLAVLGWILLVVVALIGVLAVVFGGSGRQGMIAPTVIGVVLGTSLVCLSRWARPQE